MAKIENLEALVAKLRKRAAEARKDGSPSVVVGYTAAYALFVHENREMKWRGLPRPPRGKKSEGIGVYWGPHGRAGFLLDVMREMQRELRRMIAEAMRKGKTLAQALLLAGLRLQRESQRNVPVETGNLRASAFTRLEK